MIMLMTLKMFEEEEVYLWEYLRRKEEEEVMEMLSILLSSLLQQFCNPRSMDVRM